MLIVIAGWISAALVFSSFFMKTMVPLRMVAICSNIAFMTYALLGLKYGVFGRVYPILVLHASLVPLNMIPAQAAARAHTRRARGERRRDDPLPRPVHARGDHAAGEVLFKEGDLANRLYLIQHGR